MRLEKEVLGGDEKDLTQRAEQIWIGSSFRSEYGSWFWTLLFGGGCGSCGGGGWVRT